MRELCYKGGFLPPAGSSTEYIHVRDVDINRAGYTAKSLSYNGIVGYDTNKGGFILKDPSDFVSLKKSKRLLLIN